MEAKFTCTVDNQMFDSEEELITHLLNNYASTSVVNGRYYYEINKLETDLWNQAMFDMDDSTEESDEYKKAHEIARVLDEYNKLIHEEMQKKFGINYYEFLRG